MRRPPSRTRGSPAASPPGLPLASQPGADGAPPCQPGVAGCTAQQSRRRGGRACRAAATQVRPQRLPPPPDCWPHQRTPPAPPAWHACLPTCPAALLPGLLMPCSTRCRRRLLQVRAQSSNGVGAAEVEAGSSGRRVSGAHGRPVLVPPSWESTVRSAPQLFPRGAPAAGGHAPNRLRVFSGTSNPALSQEVACYLGLELGKMKIKRFADGEIYVQVRCRAGVRCRAAAAEGCVTHVHMCTCPCTCAAAAAAASSGGRDCCRVLGCPPCQPAHAAGSAHPMHTLPPPLHSRPRAALPLGCRCASQPPPPALPAGRREHPRL